MAEYDNIADEYKASKQLPFRIYVERYTLFELLGDVRRKHILDLACGEGIYARALEDKGAAKVVGVDLSSGMIDLAKQEEQKNPRGIEYLVGNAAELGVVGSFDVVLGAYILNYAKSASELSQFCRSIYTNLKPGGRFVAINDNPGHGREQYPNYTAYGFTKSAPVPRKEGDAIQYTFFQEDGSSFSFDNFYLSEQTYEQAFKQAGFKSFAWHKPRLSPEGAAKFPKDFWATFFEHPPIVAIAADRPGWHCQVVDLAS